MARRKRRRSRSRGKTVAAVCKTTAKGKLVKSSCHRAGGKRRRSRRRR